MKEYIALCLKGESTIPERKVILEHKRAQLVERIAEIQASIDYIDWKQGFYDDVLAGRTKYFSNLVQVDGTYAQGDSSHQSAEAEADGEGYA